MKMNLTEARGNVARAMESAALAYKMKDRDRLVNYVIDTTVCLTVIAQRSKQPQEVDFAHTMLGLMGKPDLAWTHLSENDYDTGSPNRHGWLRLGGYRT